ncbi:hypothetical protein LCGC14_2821120, partial [marine sediment metagenome]
ETLLRLQPQQIEIRKRELEVIASHAREKKAIGEFLARESSTMQTGGDIRIGKIITNAMGGRARITGFDADGKPQVTVME